MSRESLESEQSSGMESFTKQADRTLSAIAEMKIKESVLPIALFITLWELISLFGIISPVYLPPFHEILVTLWELTVSFEIIEPSRITLTRGFTAYILGTTSATILGVLIGWKKRLYDYTEVLIELLRPMPAVALIPVFFLFFGPSRITLLGIIFYPIFWYQLIATIYGARSIDKTLINSMRTMKMGNYRLFKDVFLPGSLPGIFTGLRQTIATMLILTIVAEMLLANDGLGTFIMNMQRNFQTEEMYAGIITIGLIGYGLNKIFLFLQHRVLYWSEGQNSV